MSNNKKGGIYGKGYYIALILCATAIGISGYMYYRNANNTQTQLQDAVSEDVAVTQPQEDLPVVVIQPQPVLGKDDEQTSVTEPSAQPVQPKGSLKTGAPVAGQTVSVYAMDCLSYNETTRDWRVHNGVDIAAEEGAEVCAAADGIVYTTYQDDSMGMTVVIRHDGGYTTQYSSLQEAPPVDEGQSVSAGDIIGHVGTTAAAESSMGPHLHFSVSRDGKVIDPAEYVG